MYAELQWAQSTPQATILDDIAAVLTGETDTANLSASLDQGASSIIATVPAGWTVHDASAGTAMQCLKSPIADDPAAFKYLLLDYSTTYVLRLTGYDDWNATTHAGTGLYANSNHNSHAQQLNPVSYVPGVRISASEHHCVILSNHNGSKSGTVSSYGSGATGIVERTRMQPWDTVAAGYVPGAWVNFGTLSAERYSNGASHATAKSSTGSNVQGYLQLGMIGAPVQFITTTTVFPSTASGYIKDAANNDVIPLFPLYLTNTSTFIAPLGEISSLCDLWVPPRSMMVDRDEFTYGGNTYTCFGADNGMVLAVRKG